MLAIVRLLKAAVEILAMIYLGQAIVFILAGAAREQNVVFRLFKRITRPADRLLRRVTPCCVLDRHLPFVSFFLLILVWVVLTVYKIKLVLFDHPAM